MYKESLIYTAKNDGIKEGQIEGLKEGKAKGKKEGKIEGLKKGKEQGRKNREIEIAKVSIKQNIDMKTISLITGLTIDEIKSLK
ncbi:FIG00499822: hypothetical protein [hydrothermal vent metagenome]|uniref:Transposase n=1 Tax=hydrothermal vent metagenome TaxID=652676 RepID=A0A1W1C3M2_9ZZZZ